MVGSGIRIGEVARRTGLTVRTLRLYDEMGLVEASARTSGDHRLYSSQDLERLVLVQHLKSPSRTSGSASPGRKTTGSVRRWFCSAPSRITSKRDGMTSRSVRFKPFRPDQGSHGWVV